jgi:hypothetical protein
VVLAEITANRLSIRVNQLGYLQNVDTGASVPIYGVETLDLARSQDWNVTGILGQSYTVSWKGANAVEHELNFELLAGFADVQDRKALMYFIGVFHAMCAHRNHPDGENIRTPPRVRLVLSGYINCIGVMKNVRVAARGPWEISSSGAAASDKDAESGSYGIKSGLLPTSATFTGTFVLIPGMNDEGIVKVTSNTTGLAMDEVESNLYDIKV